MTAAKTTPLMSAKTARTMNTGTDPQPADRTRVIVGVDDTPAGAAALKWAVRLARSRHARLVAVHAWLLGQAGHRTRHHRHRTGPRHGLIIAGFQQHEAADLLVRRAFGAAVGRIPSDLQVTIETPEGEPGAVLTGMCTADGDVLVVGTRRASRLRRAVGGSVSRYCTQHSTCPVVVVPAPPTREPPNPRKPAESLGTGRWAGQVAVSWPQSSGS